MEQPVELIQIAVLALVQGLTEFLPISSSAHLILVPVLTGWPDQGLAFDVAVHIGTLVAVVWYFRREVVTLLRDWFASVVQRRQVGDSKLAWGVILGTIPAGLAGLVFKDYIELNLRSPLVIAITTIGFGVALGAAYAWGKRDRSEHDMSWADMFAIGVAQAIALIPGTSRSGITITAGLMLGLSGTAAARFSFLLSIPIIVLAGGLNGLELLKASEPVDWNALLIGTALSALSAYLCIHWFLKLLDRIGMMPFVAYRMVLGGVLLVMFL